MLKEGKKKKVGDPFKRRLQNTCRKEGIRPEFEYPELKIPKLGTIGKKGTGKTDLPSNDYGL